MIRTRDGICSAIVMLLLASVAMAHTGTPPRGGATAETRVTPAGGVLRLERVSAVVRDIELVVPGGAVSKPTTLSMTIVTSPSAHAYGPRPFVAVRMGPAGASFLRPVSLRVRYNWQDLHDEGALDPRLIRAVHWRPEALAWAPIPSSVNAARAEVTAQLRHFSVYGLIVPRIYPNPTQCKVTPEVGPTLLVHGFDRSQDALGPATTSYGQTKAQLLKPGCAWGVIAPSYYTDESDCEAGGHSPPSHWWHVPLYELRYFTLDDIEASACALKFAIHRIRTAFPTPWPVKVAAHSMGGLVTRAYIQGLGDHRQPNGKTTVRTNKQYTDTKQPLDIVGKGACPYDKDIARVVTLATPHGGASPNVTAPGSALLYNNVSVKQMIRGSDFLKSLNSKPPLLLQGSKPHYISYYAEHDEVVSPYCTMTLVACPNAYIGKRAPLIVCKNAKELCRNAASMRDNLGLAARLYADQQGHVVDGPSHGRISGTNHTGTAPVFNYPGIARISGAEVASNSPKDHPTYKILCDFVGACWQGKEVCRKNCCGIGCHAGVCAPNASDAVPCEVSGTSTDTLYLDKMCFGRGGNYWWHGESGGAKYWYTWTTDASEPDSWGKWHFRVKKSAHLAVSVKVPAFERLSRKARYKLWFNDKAIYKTVDLSKYAGNWAPLGTHYLKAGFDHAVRLNDNTGEKYEKGKSPALVYAALRMMPDVSINACATPPCDEIDAIGTEKDASHGQADSGAEQTGGCQAGDVVRKPMSEWPLCAGWLVAFFGVLAIRRRLGVRYADC